MTQETWIRVPVGPDAPRWTTRSSCRRVLLVVHNVTSATRLGDILPLFHDDLRVQLLATCTGSSPFQSGVPELLGRAGIPVLPWEQAVATPVDLAISASYGGELHRIQGKLAVLSHGAGYNKKLSREPGAGSREPGAGSREPGAGSREPGAGSREPAFGMGPEWLLHEGRPLADATVLSHPEQLDRLRHSCPEAAPTAVLAGDPCYDRLLAALGERERFRRAFGAGRGRRLIVLNSTWNPGSLFGDGGPGGSDVLPSLLPRLTAELPADEYRIVAVLHPNIWHGHGPGQVRAWLHGARRAGLTPLPPLDGWRQALAAASLVIGDQGSVTFYGAAVGVPVLLCSAPGDGLDPESPVARFVRTAPRLDPYGPLRSQVEAAMGSAAAGAVSAEAAEQVTSLPGGSAAALREAFYRLIGLPEPERAARLAPLPVPEFVPGHPTSAMRVLTTVRGTAPPRVAVARFAGPEFEPDGEGGGHLAVPEETEEPQLLDLADVIVRTAHADDPRFGPPAAWAEEVLRRRRHCALAVRVTGPGRCVAVDREGNLFVLRELPGPSGMPSLCDPAAFGSALHAWLAGGGGHDELREHGLVLETGDTAHPLRVRRITGGRTDGTVSCPPGPRRPRPAG